MKRSILISVILALVVAVSLGTAPVFAGTETTTGTQGATAATKTARVEKLLKREQTVLAKQQQRCEKSQQLIVKTEQWIAKLQEQGKDTAALEAALSAFKTGVESAKKYLDRAQSILAAHAGFDSGGHVTDLRQARKTVRDAGRAERQFHLDITKAATKFRAEVKAYRQAD